MGSSWYRGIWRHYFPEVPVYKIIDKRYPMARLQQKKINGIYVFIF